MEYQKIKKYKYRIYKDVTFKVNIYKEAFIHKFFKMDSDGNLTINSGYLWDGVSGPAIDSKNTMKAGCLHDALYQAIRLKLLPLKYKRVIDLEYYKQLKKDGVSNFRASYHYWAVDKFGGSSCKPGNIHIPDIITV